MEVKTMIESENNQTKIVGCTLLSDILKKMSEFVLSDSVKLPLMKISGEYVHYLAFIEEYMSLILPSQIYHVQKTNFISVWMELLEGIV